MIDQVATFYVQQICCGEISFQNEPIVADGKIAYRRQIIEVKITLPGGFQFQLST